MWWWLGVGAVVWGRGDVTCRKASQTSVGLQETARGAEVVDALSAACGMSSVSEDVLQVMRVMALCLRHRLA
jgi:hypothetical protein